MAFTKASTSSEASKCSICLEEVACRGLLTACSHLFCFECILEWSKVENCCPLCKSKFRVIKKINHLAPGKSPSIRQIRVGDKRQRVWNDDDSIIVNDVVGEGEGDGDEAENETDWLTARINLDEYDLEDSFIDDSDATQMPGLRELGRNVLRQNSDEQKSNPSGTSTVKNQKKSVHKPKPVSSESEPASASASGSSSALQEGKEAFQRIRSLAAAKSAVQRGPWLSTKTASTGGRKRGHPALNSKKRRVGGRRRKEKRVAPPDNGENVDNGLARESNVDDSFDDFLLSSKKAKGKGKGKGKAVMLKNICNPAPSIQDSRNPFDFDFDSD